MHKGQKFISFPREGYYRFPLIKSYMATDDALLSKISEISELHGTLYIDEKGFSLERLSVKKSKIPVRKPTTRGGVYFTNTTAYKAKASTRVLSIIDEIRRMWIVTTTDLRQI